jgi:hypothetical protein
MIVVAYHSGFRHFAFLVCRWAAPDTRRGKPVPATGARPATDMENGHGDG